MNSHAETGLELPGLSAPATDPAIERYVQAFAHRARHRRVSDREFEIAVRGYARARAIAYDDPRELGTQAILRLRSLFRSLRNEAIGADGRPRAA